MPVTVCLERNKDNWGKADVVRLFLFVFGLNFGNYCIIVQNTLKMAQNIVKMIQNHKFFAQNLSNLAQNTP